MKRVLAMLAALLLAAFPALADPLLLDEDLAGTIVILYDETDPSAGSYTYSYRFPCISGEDPDAMLVNIFYRNRVEERETNVSFEADGYADSGKTVTKNVSYRITCNNDDYFSVLVTTEYVSGDESWITWQGHTFPRKDGTPDATFDLARLLGLLGSGNLDEYQQNRQTEKAGKIVCGMIMDRIGENPDGIPYFDTFSEEDLEYGFYPEEDFYLDENGDPVFFLEPGVAADESLGYLLFPIPLEDIEDEL